jgi:hypothetical protein
VERENPNEISEMVDALSKLTARKAELLSGKGRIKKRMLLAERQQEKITERIGPMLEIPTLKDGRRDPGASPKERCKEYKSREKLGASSTLSKRNRETD